MNSWLRSKLRCKDGIFRFHVIAISVKLRGDEDWMEHKAYLTSQGEYTKFIYGDRTITFLTSKNLEKYLKILEWDRGYLVVISKNYDKSPEEDYIDLVPILRNLMIDPDDFLKPIKEVEIRYA